ncbi:cytochrome c oxidase accessory protein CcoG [Azospira restricta]|uniref:Cytochrome c oxidase accessory protein CcoG n=1 Tax=Azospira restricta TaxID=404405 RepID=A0A974PYA3_9RHOO|nr:cytochrome c oxidase accessory protein CcoG [Azospira restricta]QRJ63409.1 cytochrome c oxidase accessory protein CcoG [Azospira restricta]
MNQPQDSGVQVAVVNTQSLYEKHKKVYPRSVTGLFANWRWGMVWFTQLIFYGMCWLEWNGRQAVLFHVVERKFYLFGLVLWPQDVLYLAFALIIGALALFLVTAVGGRLFCGYVCPQTVYTEILLWIEARIEGERPARMKLDKGPRDARWWRLKTVKHALWLLVALWTGFTFVGYFTPIRELTAAATTLSFGPWEWFWILFYAAFLYMQAGFLREQVCKYMCPYARFQGVMFDPDTLIISYDPERGEPRAPRKKGTDYKAMGLGDCIDCGQCVQVCPTGIDIRDGLQMECIACAACIDVCDQVMDKVGYPRGLIRYSTEAALEKHYTKQDILAHLMRPRTLLYGGILAAICIATGWSMATRVPLKVDVIRDRGVLSREADDGRIENLYTLHIMNTGETAHRFVLGVSGLEGIDIAGERLVEVPAASLKSVSVAVRVEADAGKKGSNPIRFEVAAQNHEKIAVSEKATFLLP